jgi:hypothetical protein
LKLNVAGINLSPCTALIGQSLLSEKPQVTEAAVGLAKALLMSDSTEMEKLLPVIIKSTQPGPSNETRIYSLQIIGWLAKSCLLNLQHLQAIVPSVMTCTRDRTVPIKLAAERCIVHTLQLKSGTKVLEKYLTTLDKNSASGFSEFSLKLRNKMAEDDSDAE